MDRKLSRAIPESAIRGPLRAKEGRVTFPRDAAGAMVAAYLSAGAGFVNPAVPCECRVAVSLDAL